MKMHMSPFALILGCLIMPFYLGTLRFLGWKDCLWWGIIPSSLSNLLLAAGWSSVGSSLPTPWYCEVSPTTHVMPTTEIATVFLVSSLIPCLLWRWFRVFKVDSKSQKLLQAESFGSAEFPFACELCVVSADPLFFFSPPSWYFCFIEVSFWVGWVIKLVAEHISVEFNSFHRKRNSLSEVGE